MLLLLTQIAVTPVRNPALLDTTQDVVERTETGVVNWTQGWVRAKGWAAINPKERNKAKARLMAVRAAKVVAMRNLLETVKGVYINSETRVRDMMAESDEIVARVEGVVKGARMVGEPKVEGGVVEVVMEMPLWGKKSLAEAVAPEKEVVKAKPDPKAAKKLEETPCVVVDAHEAGARPALAPRFYDEKGNLILDLRKLGAGVQYVKDLSQVVRCGDKSLVIRAVEAKGRAKADLVVKEEDKEKLELLKKAGKLLWKAGKFILTLL